MSDAARSFENLDAEIAAVFAEVLGLPEVGRDDDFFALGGHSLLAMTLIGRLRDRTGLQLALRDVFQAPTPARLAERIQANA
ncbi:MAG TPA: phosphopantetheine-binding protein [Solirubrobacteraceae bacterium]|nr:phosphopantetheine-binding protein [Solirubrobacteraceae bacterium]